MARYHTRHGLKEIVLVIGIKIGHVRQQCNGSAAADWDLSSASRVISGIRRQPRFSDSKRRPFVRRARRARRIRRHSRNRARTDPDGDGPAHSRQRGAP